MFAHSETRTHAHPHTNTLWPLWLKLLETPNKFSCFTPVLNVARSCLPLAFMAPHLTLEELADLRAWAAQGLDPTEIHKRHSQSRRQQSKMLKPLCLTAVRKALRGVAHRGGEERRGAKRKLSQRAVRALDAKRIALIDKCEGTREVHWDEVIKKARVKPVHPTTAKRSLVDAGIPVATRRNRDKPQRKKEHVVERWEKCGENPI